MAHLRREARVRSAAAATLLFTAGCAALSSESLELSLDRAREAMARSSASGGTFEIRGRLRTAQGGEVGFVDLVGPRGRFVRRIEGNLGYAEGFDGRTVWRADPKGRSWTVDLDARNELLGQGWLRWGQWLDDLPGGPAVGRTGGWGGGDLKLVIGPGWSVTVVLDPMTGLPEYWTRELDHGRETVQLEDWRSPYGFAIPFKSRKISPRGTTTTCIVESVEPIIADLDRDTTLERFTWVAEPYHHDPDASAECIARVGPGGQAFVRVELEGEDAGWFLVDSGAGRGVIDTGLADRLGWATLGSVSLAGTGSPVQANWRRGGGLAVGQLRMSETVWVGYDLGLLESSLGLRISGILGHDVLSRTAVEMDLAEGRVWFHGPDAAREFMGTPLSVSFDGTAPCIRGRFSPGVDGVFRVDTGSDDTITFHPRTVRENRWPTELEGSQRVTVSGFGGSSRGRRIQIPWVELARTRLEQLPVTLLESSSGPLARPSISGNLGVGVLREFRVLLDLGQERIVLRPRGANPVGAGDGLR